MTTRLFLLAVLSFLLGICGTAVSLRPETRAQRPAAAANPAASTSSRRQWLASTAGALTVATTACAKANADPSVASTIQGPLQDVIAPGHWIGQFVGLNSQRETWKFPNHTPQEVSKALVDVLEGLTPERKAKLYMPEFQIQTADATKIHVLTWTKLEWLDSLDVRLSPGSGNQGCVATASFYATGFLPTSIPLAPFLNVGMAWFPFASPGPRGEMLQKFRLRALKGLVTKELEAKAATPDATA